MPFKSEKQRRYLWANEPEIARDWTDTYGSRIHKNEGGIMQAGVKNYLGKQKMVKAPLHWQSSPDHPKTELAYITQAEKDLLVKRDLHNSLHGGVNRGPAGIMSLNGWGSSDPGQNRAGADISAGMDRDPGHKGWSAPGGFTSPHAKSPAELKSLADRKGSSTVMPSSFYGNQSTNRGINFSFPGQNFMRNIHPLRWAGNLIDNPFVSGAWSFLTSPLSGMSNLRQGMTQQEWEDARNERIRNKRIENILGRKAPITDMTLKNLERLGYTGEMPGVGSTPTSRAIAKDFEREGDDITYARSHLASLGDKMGITSTQAYEDFPPNVALSKQMGSLQTGAIPYETFGADKPVDKYAWDKVVGDKNEIYGGSIEPAAFVKEPLLKAQSWYKAPLKLRQNTLSTALGENAQEKMQAFQELKSLVPQGSLTIENYLKLAQQNKIPSIIAEDMNEQVLEAIKEQGGFGETFQKDWSTGVVEPTIKGGRIDIDETKLEDKEAEKYLEI